MNCEPDNLSSKGAIVFLAANASYAHTNLAGWYLRRYAESAGWSWHEEEIIRDDSLSAALLRVLRLNPDIIAASFYLFNSNFLLSFLSRFKAMMQNCLVIGGGPEFLGDNRDFLEKHPEVDAVVRGEGEQAFADWLDCCRQPKKWRRIKGLCAFINGTYIDNGKAEILTDLDDIPSPFHRNLMYRNFPPEADPPSADKKVGPDCQSGRGPAGPRLWRGKQDCLPRLERGPVLPVQLHGFKKPFLLLETSRGCSNKCAFCTSAGQRVRFFSLARVKNDLALIAAAGVRELRIADRTFNEKAARCTELIKIMRDEFKNVRFHLEIDPARVSDEMIQELSRAEPGRFHLETGIQTTCSKALRSIGRFGPADRALAALNQLCRLRNLAIHVDLIAGLPGVTLADLQADLHQLALMQPDEIQLELLKVLPGTRLSKEKGKFGIIAASEPPYEVLQTANMSPDDIFAAQRLSRLVDWFYNTAELQQPLLAAIKLVPAFFGRFADFCGDVIDESHAPALENRFRLLEQFARLYENALIPKLGYAWLKCGLSAQHGICRATHWKKPLPKEAVLVEGNGGTAQQRVYLAELERPYLFVYGQYPRRQASAVYVL